MKGHKCTHTHIYTHAHAHTYTQEHWSTVILTNSARSTAYFQQTLLVGILQLHTGVTMRSDLQPIQYKNLALCENLKKKMIMKMLLQQPLQLLARLPFGTVSIGIIYCTV